VLPVVRMRVDEVVDQDRNSKGRQDNHGEHATPPPRTRNDGHKSQNLASTDTSVSCDMPDQRRLSSAAEFRSEQMNARHDETVGVRQVASPRALAAIGIFLIFGAAMAALAGTTLTLPGTFLDRTWVLNPKAHDQLAPYGKIVGPLFLILAALLALASAGWFRRRIWGWRLTVAIIATQVLGDLVNFLRGDFLRGGTGFLIAGALLLYLLSAPVRASFEPTTHSV
jgi:hypothetical protein